MRIGLVFSILMHGAILGWAFYSIQATEQLVVPDVPTIEAKLITPSEFTRLRQGDPDSEKMEAKAKDEPKKETSKKEAEKPKPKAAPPPPASEPPPPAEPKAAEKPPEPEKPKPYKPPEPEKPKPDPIAEKLAGLPPPPASPSQEERKKLEAERKKIAEAQRKKREAKRRKEEARRNKLAEAKRKAAEKKREFDADRIAALLDKTPEKRGAPRSNPREPTSPTDYTGPTAGERESRGDELTAREADLLKGRISAQIRGCWRLPGGGGGIETTVVTLRWQLKPDGSLSGLPQIVSPRNDTVFRIAAEAAKRAVICASPFTLPPETFKAWQTITWDFDPRHML